jgi:hypothetical protein
MGSRDRFSRVHALLRSPSTVLRRSKKAPQVAEPGVEYDPRGIEDVDSLAQHFPQVEAGFVEEAEGVGVAGSRRPDK